MHCRNMSRGLIKFKSNCYGHNVNGYVWRKKGAEPWTNSEAQAEGFAMTSHLT